MTELPDDTGKERIFVIIGHRVRTDPKFNLNDLCGSTGRLDILLRTVNSSFLLSNGIRRNVRVYFVLLGEPVPPVAIRLIGDELKYLNPDERSTGALIRQALIARQKRDEGSGDQDPSDDPTWMRSSPGIYIAKCDFSRLVEDLKGEGRTPYYLHETGQPIRTMDHVDLQKMFFVLGDQYDLTDEEEAVLGEEAGRISLGLSILHTDHCVILIHNALDDQSL